MSEQLFGGATSQMMQVNKQLSEIQKTLDALTERLQSSQMTQEEMRTATLKAASQTAAALKTLKAQQSLGLPQDETVLSWWRSRK